MRATTGISLTDAGRKELADGLAIALAWARRFGDGTLSDAVTGLVDHVLAAPGLVTDASGPRADQIATFVSDLAAVATGVFADTLSDCGLRMEPGTQRELEGHFLAAFANRAAQTFGGGPK